MDEKDELPRPAAELESLAEYYATHDTAEELDADVDGVWVEPPMVTTSLRLPKPLMDALKAEAGELHIRHTALMRKVLAAHVAGEAPRPAEIIDRLDRIERILSSERKAG